MLTGSELLAKVKELGDAPKTDLAKGCGYIVTKKDGEVMEQGSKAQMFTPPHHPYTDLLLSSVPEMDPDWLTNLLAERGRDNIGDAASGKID